MFHIISELSDAPVQCSLKESDQLFKHYEGKVMTLGFKCVLLCPYWLNNVGFFKCIVPKFKDNANKYSFVTE